MEPSGSPAPLAVRPRPVRTRLPAAVLSRRGAALLAIAAVGLFALPGLYAVGTAPPPARTAAAATGSNLTWTAPYTNLVASNSSTAYQSGCGSHAVVNLPAGFSPLTGAFGGAVSVNQGPAPNCTTARGRSGATFSDAYASFGFTTANFSVGRSGAYVVRVDLQMAWHELLQFTVLSPNGVCCRGGSTTISLYAQVADMSLNTTPYTIGATVGGYFLDQNGSLNLTASRAISLPMLLPMTQGDSYQILFGLYLDAELQGVHGTYTGALRLDLGTPAGGGMVSSITVQRVG